MEILDSVGRVIRQASDEIIMPIIKNQSKAKIFKKCDGSAVTNADLQVDGFLSERLQKIIPGSSFVSEESQRDGDINKPYVWLVDPIDGTDNFINGSKDFAVVVALMNHSTPISAWIYLPYSKQMLCGNDRRVFLNGSPFQQDKERTVKTVKVNSSLAKYAEETFDLVKIRSCSCSYFSAITGKIDAVVFDKALLPWDHIPGTFLHKVSGGHNSLINENAYKSCDLQTPITDTLISAPNIKVWSHLKNKVESWKKRSNLGVS